MKLSEEMSARIEAEIAKLAPKGGGHIDDEGIAYRGLPLFGTIGAVLLLRSDGSLWTVDSDLGIPLQPLPENRHTMALVLGAERYRWLAELLPRRPPDAATCTACAGSGYLGHERNVPCPSCECLGWLSGRGR